MHVVVPASQYPLQVIIPALAGELQVTSAAVSVLESDSEEQV